MNREKTIEVAPSLMAGDFGAMAYEARRLQDAGADAIHLDIMDGHFVRNLTFGHQMVAAVNRATDLFLDVHLMIYSPYDYIERFIEAGADRITFHFEATEDVEDTLEYIRRSNVQAGLAFCPETSAAFIPKYLDKCDNILIMTVHPGFGGQEFIPDVLDKIRFTRDVCTKLDLHVKGKTPEEKRPFPIQVDGGIDDKTAKLCYEAGADRFVSGSYVFRSPDIKVAIQKIRDVTKV